MWHLTLAIWPYFIALLNLGVNIIASGHAVLNKRDTRAATGWVGLIWLVPFLGAILYLLLGINRIQRKARALAQKLSPHEILNPNLRNSAESSQAVPRIESIEAGKTLPALSHLVDQLTEWPLVEGNRIDSYVNGDEAFPQMLEAIERARSSVSLMSYIFDSDCSGETFCEALRRANERGVEVRVLIDDIGARYSRPSMPRLLQRAGINVARFLPTKLPWRFRYANLRNHRKILVVDGKVGFTGGMNICEGNMLALNSHHPIQDIHFSLKGPVVGHLQEVFAEDWAFSTNEKLQGETWFPQLRREGSVTARGINDGPDEDFDKLRFTLLGALACAQQSIAIVNPYFLPDGSLMTSLIIAAMRGIEVDIVVPDKNNLRLVQWASTALYWQLLQRRCRIWASPPPFDHSKLVIVDEVWALIGSANWDPRSFRLNFEFNVECYNRELAEQLTEMVRRKIEKSRPVTYQEVEGRPLAIKLRDNVARLFSPYL